MTIRVVSPADGTMSVTFGWDLAEVILAKDQLVDVAPGSALEAAIGLANLADPAAQQLASVSNGGGGTRWTSN